MSSTPLLNDIKAAYQRAFLPYCTTAEKPQLNITHGAADNRLTAGDRGDAKRQLEEHLSFLCTSILIGGEQFVREFPSQLYVPVLTDILVAAHAPPAGTGDGVNPLTWDMQEESVTSVTKPGKQPRRAGTHRYREGTSTVQSSIHCVGFQMASPIELLATRAMALIAGDVPRGSYAMRTTKSPQTIPVFAAYLSDADFLVLNDELTEELLKCFLYLTLVAHETCVELNVPRCLVELLLVVEQHHLRVLCVQILSNMLARAREVELGEVWSPVLALLVESLTDFIANSSFQSEAQLQPSSPLLQRRSSAGWAGSVSSPSRSPLRQHTTPTTATSVVTATSGPRTVTAKDRTLLMHYVESIVHAFDRLFVEVAAMECHVCLIEKFVEICVQLLRTSVQINPVEDRWNLRSLALSPLTTLYLISPTFAVPLLLRLRVWEAVCGCLLATVARKQLDPVGTRMGGPPPPPPPPATQQTDTAETAADDAVGNTNASASSSALGGGATTSNTADSVGEAGASTTTNPRDGATEQPNATSVTSGPVLTTDVMTIPFISDEQELLPMLEFLLILTPCARRGHSHFDYRNTTGPFYRWTWEDDFHNEVECNELLCRRLERAYQLTRHFRTHDRYAMTHGKQRVFYADFLSKVYLSDRKQRHSLHRRPLLAGYVHDTRNAFLHGCTCCAVKPDPLFTTWANRSIMQLRNADTASSGGGPASNGAVRNARENEGEGHSNNTDIDGGGNGVCMESAQLGLTRSSSAPSVRGSRPANNSSQCGSPGSHTGGHPALNNNGAADALGTSMMASQEQTEAVETLTPSRGGQCHHSYSHNSDHSHRSSADRSRRQVAFQDRDGNDDNAGEDAADRGEEVDEEEDETALDDYDPSSQGSRHDTHRGTSCCGGGGFFCSCGDGGDNATAAHRAVGTRLRLPGVSDGASAQSQKRALVTITLLPLEAMLEDPMEKLQNDPATRRAFMGKDILSHLVPTMLPALLSLMDNCVNPLVARHSMALLLRCLSLCADLRTQVTGEAIELPVNGTTNSPATAATAAGATTMAVTLSGKEKGNKRFQSFRKWITGSSGNGAMAPRWQRTEWQNTQTALQCFVPSLRDHLVGLYLMEGVHIVAGRQEVFASMKDDLPMADELARVHIAPEFCSYQLSVPSEQLVTAADVMVLLMGIFPKAKRPNAPPASSKASGKNSKRSSFRKPPQPHQYTVATANTVGHAASLTSRDPMVESFTSYVKSARGSIDNNASSLSPLPPLPPGFPNNDASVLLELVPPATATDTSNAAIGGGTGREVETPEQSAVAASGISPPPLPALPKSAHDDEEDGGSGRSHSLFTFATTKMSAPALTENLKGGKVPRPSVILSSPDDNANSYNYTNGGGSGSVFTLHQVTLLLNYAHQVIDRGPRVCAAANQIEQAMQHNEFKSIVVLGSSGDNVNRPAAAAAAPPLLTKELTLRMSPAASCPYHFSFSHCAENFFDASKVLFQTLTNVSGDEALDAAVTETTAPAAVATACRDVSSKPFKSSKHSSLSADEEEKEEERRRSDDTDSNPISNIRTDSSSLSGAAADSATADTSLSPPPAAAASAQAAKKRNILRRGRPPQVPIAAASTTVDGDLPIEVKVSVVPKTIDLREMRCFISAGASDPSGRYRQLPRPLRSVLLFYDYCKEHNIELQAVMVEIPDFLLSLSSALGHWYNIGDRLREDTELLTSAHPAYAPFDGDRVASAGGATAATSPFRSDTRTPTSDCRLLRLDSVTRGKLLCLASELGATVSRDLGFATLNLDPSIVVKQPCSFVKRAKRMKSFGAVRHLAWHPLDISIDAMTCPQETAVNRWKMEDGEGKTRERQMTVMVENVPLPIVGGVRLRKSSFTVLPSTTMASLAAAVAKQVQLPATLSSSLWSPSPHTSSLLRNGTTTLVSTQLTSAAVALHAVQERQHSFEQVASPVLTESSPYLTSEEFFEDGNNSCGAQRGVSADRILFFIGEVPMISPLTTLLDALATYAETGYSLRYLVTTPQQLGESDEAHRNKIQMTLPTIPFWVCKHEIKFVVLQKPLPLPLMIGVPLTSTWTMPNQRRCGCSHMDPPFFCSARHLYEIGPNNGGVALCSILTKICRREFVEETGSLDSSQRRLSSAVVHQLYQHLSMFMLPPLLYSSGIGAAIPGTSMGVVAATREARPEMRFPTASDALWAFPNMFSMDMRVSILRFFISAHRSLSFEQCRIIFQGHQNLLVRRAAGEQNFGTEETRTTAGGGNSNNNDAAFGQTEGPDKRLDVLGLEWLSEEVLRRRRVTLTVDRRHILQSAEQLFVLATCTFTLDVAFKGEAGIGPGPAMEFYELVAEELLNPKYGLFRSEEIPHDDECENSSNNAAAAVASRSSPPRGRRSCKPLFPAARQTPQSLHYWELLGLLLGRLLMMGERSSLCFHPLLLRRMLGEAPLADTILPIRSNLELIDPQLSASLQQLITMSPEELEACDLYFTIPMNEADNCSLATDVELPMMEGGERRRVTRENVEEYANRLDSYYLQTVPDLALLYLRRGLQYTVNPVYLELFTSTELGRLFGSAQDAKIWESREQFARCIEAGHGYHKRSDVVQYLLDVVPQWNAQLQHSFLKFVTGSSCVPYGGLTQVIKVVRRDIDATNFAESSPHHNLRPFAGNDDTSGANRTPVGGSAILNATQSHSFGLNTACDQTLPTVSTCFLYLKLPQYSSKAVLEERLRFAVCEGSNFFALT